MLVGEVGDEGVGSGDDAGVHLGGFWGCCGDYTGIWGWGVALLK